MRESVLNTKNFMKAKYSHFTFGVQIQVSCKGQLNLDDFLIDILISLGCISILSTNKTMQQHKEQSTSLTRNQH